MPSDPHTMMRFLLYRGQIIMMVIVMMTDYSDDNVDSDGNDIDDDDNCQR